MALNDLIGEMRGLRSPLESATAKQRLQEDRDLQALKIKSEAYYKTQQGLSERQDRDMESKEAARIQAIMQDPNMPKRTDYLDPTAPAGEQGQALQNYFRDVSTYMWSNYPDVAEEMGMKASDVRQAAGDIDVGIKEEKASAEAEMARQTANAAKSGLGATAVEPGSSALWEAEETLKKLGRTGPAGGVSESDVQRLAEYGMVLRQAMIQQNPNVPPEPMQYYMAMAAQKLFGQGQGGGMAQPPAQEAPQQGGGSSWFDQAMDAISPKTNITAPTPMPNQMGNTGGRGEGRTEGRRVIDLSNIR